MTQHRLTVVNGSGGGVYNDLTKHTIVANSAPDCDHWGYWTVSGSGYVDSTSNSTTGATLDGGDLTCTAHYYYTYYDVYYYGSTGGGVSNGGGTVQCGFSTSSTAQPYNGYHFTQWSDGSTNPTHSTSDTRGNANYTAYFAQDAPTITSIDVNRGPSSGGTVVTITGTNFTGVTSVTFDYTAALSYNVYSSEHITATSPGHIPGVININVTTPGGTASIAFTYYSAGNPEVVSPFFIF